MKQGTMFDKLAGLGLRGNSKPRRKDNIKDPAPSPMLWKGDGEDHINIWEGAETELGQLLAHNSPLPFVHNVFGRFSSMEAFWHYIQSNERDDRIRTMSGQTLKTFSKKLTMARVTNFRAIIMHSNWQRVKQYKVLVDVLRKSDLPFDCYYVNSTSGIRVRPTFFNWFNKGFEEIRKAIKEDREPDFSFLLDRRDSAIYQFVAPNFTVKKEQANKDKQETKASLLSQAQIEAQQISEDNVDLLEGDDTSGNEVMSEQTATA